jgi:hypothetical protein
MKKKDQPLPGENTTSASEADAQATPPATPKLFRAIIVDASPEDYEKGFSVGFMTGTWRDQPPMSSFMSDSPDRSQDQPQGKSPEQTNEPNS